MGGAGNIGGLGLGAAGIGLTNFSAQAAVGKGASGNAGAAPAVTVGISSEALQLLGQAAAFGGSSSLNGVATQTVTGIGSLASTGGLANKLVEAAVLAAVLDDSKDDDKKNKLAMSLIVAAAVQAYQQAANLPGVSIVTPVLGTGTSISISTGAAAGA